MKRQKAFPREIALDDVWSFLQSNELNCDQLSALGKEIDRLYAVKASALVQNFPSELWLAIFPRVEATSSQQDAHFWLSARLVSKSWHSSIAKIDLAPFVPAIEDTKLNVTKVLQVFKFSRLQLLKTAPDFSLLTNVKSLHLTPSSLPPHQVNELAKLTQLTSLSLSMTRVPSAILLLLTNLESLHLCATKDIKEIHTLTNLRSLTLLNSELDQSSTKMLPNLTDIKTDKPNFFRAGSGTCLYNSNIRYVGEWFSGRRHGQGTHYFDCGDVYSGDWDRDKMHGRGTLRIFDKRTQDFCGFYDGEFRDNSPQGKGLRVYLDESYDGHWAPGEVSAVKHGHGIYRFRDGTIYDGQWKQDQIIGEGKCMYPNGDVYEGAWSEGKRSGGGVYVFAHGRRVEGNWLAGNLYSWDCNQPVEELNPSFFCGPLEPEVESNL